MIFKIGYHLPNGTEDYVVISGDTVEEIREKAMNEVAKRDGRDPWSEEIKS